MELRHYRYFLAAAEELNISRASRRLNVSQPAMSRLIRDLECELGTPLFHRERFGVALTDAGKNLLIYARQILDISNEAVRVLQNKTESQCITFGFITSSLGSFLGAALKAFHESFPKLTVEVRELSPAGQVTALRKGQIDIALVGNPFGSIQNEFKTVVLFEMQLEAVLPTTHQLAKMNEISLKVLEKEDFIGYREEYFPGRNQTIINACKLAGFKPLFAHQANSRVEILALIEAGSGVCLLPSDVVNLPHPNSIFIPLAEKIEPINFTAAWRKNDERPIVEILLELIKQIKLNKHK
jgi:DNA-binding transcriptional LysR family regulator